MGSLKSTARKVGIRSLIFLAYLFIGAGVFLALEENDKFKNIALDYDRYRVKFQLQFNITDAEMSTFDTKTREAAKAGYFKTGGATEWNFVTAFLFCGNVVTTIGYGHITPKTIAGRIICMVYALFGIPLTGFFLRTVGNELTTFIAYLVKYWERRIYNREAEKVEMKSAVVASLMVLFMLFLGALIFDVSEETWSYLDAFYFCFVTLTTIGFGDLVPGLNRKNLVLGESFAVELAALVYYVIGLSIMSGVILSISGVIEEKTKKLDIVDPLEAIKNIRIENLNSKALKKLGYEGGTLGPENDAYLAARRGTVVMDALGPRRISIMVQDSINASGRASRTSNGIKRPNDGGNIIPPMVPNGTVRQKSFELKEEEEETKNSILSRDSRNSSRNEVTVDVEITSKESRENSPAAQSRTLSGGSIRLKQKNKVHPTLTATKSDPKCGLHSNQPSEDDFRPDGDIGLPSEIFAVSFKTRRRKEDLYNVRKNNEMEEDLNKIINELENSPENLKKDKQKLCKTNLTKKSKSICSPPSAAQVEENRRSNAMLVKSYSNPEVT